MKFLIAFGTRPEYIKIKPIIKLFDEKQIDYKMLFTGQHVDLLSKVEGDIHKINIQDGPNRLDSIVASIINNESIFENIDTVIVQGDTTSVFAVALAAFHRRIKIVHLEAGLRTFNKNHPFPEEFNRRAVAAMADIHLSPTDICTNNLEKERVDGKIFTVGNTVLDNLVDIKPEYTNKIVITMHRRENHHIIPDWFAAFDKLAKDNPQYEFIIPLHPNPNVQKHKDLLKYVKVVEPMDYDEFIILLSKSRLVLTDSGGLQEESSFFNKKCIVCRENTERVEGMGTFAFMSSPEKVESDFYLLIDDYIPDDECPYGDGCSAERIGKILMEEL
jgi:UDP-N-acetylglucosamine 2-epimerase (non-hydrolysing)